MTAQKIKSASANASHGNITMINGDYECLWGFNAKGDNNPWHGLNKDKAYDGEVPLEAVKDMFDWDYVKLRNTVNWNDQQFETTSEGVFRVMPDGSLTHFQDVGSVWNAPSNLEWIENHLPLIELCQKNGGGVTGAFTLGGGGVRVLSLMLDPNPDKIGKRWSQYTYFNCIGSLDGRFSGAVAMNSKRVECQNMTQHAYDGTDLRVRHTQGHSERYSEMVKLIEQMWEAKEKQNAAFKQMLTKEFNALQLKQFYCTVFDVPLDPTTVSLEEILKKSSLARLAQKCHDLDPTIADMRGSVAGYYNGVTGALTHLTGGKHGDQQSLALLEAGSSVVDFMRSEMFAKMDSLKQQSWKEKVGQRTVANMGFRNKYNTIHNKAQTVALSLVS